MVSLMIVVMARMNFGMYANGLRREKEEIVIKAPSGLKNNDIHVFIIGLLIEEFLTKVDS